jgi:hypothetical protein
MKSGIPPSRTYRYMCPPAVAVPRSQSAPFRLSVTLDALPGDFVQMRQSHSHCTANGNAHCLWPLPLPNISCINRGHTETESSAQQKARKGAEKSGRRGQSKDETRRGGRQGSIGREGRVRQAKRCTVQGGSFSNQKTFGVSQPSLSSNTQPQQRGRKGGREGSRHARVRLRGLI